MKSLNQLTALRLALLRLRTLYLNRVWGMSIDPSARVSLRASLDLTYPKGIHIGAETTVAFEAAILSHDMSRGLYRNTVIGKRCFIGARSVILPGIVIGDGSMVAAGAVVTRDVPPRSVVAGNPAKVVRSDIDLGPFGRFTYVDQPPQKEHLGQPVGSLLTSAAEK